MESTNKVKLVNLSCPSCGGKLIGEENTKKLVCQSCNNLVIPVSDPVSTNGTNAQQAIKIDGINNPQSGIAFVEQFFATFEWESFQLDSNQFSIPAIDRLVENLKTTSADNPLTWVIQFESIATPIEMKISGINHLEALIEKLYAPNEITEVFSKFDNVKSIIFALQEKKAGVIKHLNTSLELAKRYGLEASQIKDLQSRIISIEDQINQLKSYEFIEDMPLIKEKKDKHNDYVALSLKSMNIDADTTYAEASKFYNQGDFNKALALFLIIKDYKNSYLFIRKIQRDYQFVSYLEIANKPYLLTSPEQTNSYVPSTVSSKNLYKVVDNLGLQPPVIRDIQIRLNTYGNKFFYINLKNEICVYHQDKNTSSFIGKFSGNVSTFKSYMDSTGMCQRFLVSNDIGYTNDNSYTSAPNLNQYYLASLNYQTEKYEILLKNISSLVDVLDEKIIYYSVPQKSDNVGYQPSKKLFVYDIASKANVMIGLDTDTFQEFYKGNAIILRNKGHESNFDLIAVSMETLQQKLIERNVYDYFKVIHNRFYYNVGNEENNSLISNSIEGNSRRQVLRYMKEVLFTQEQYLYILQGNRYRSGLIRFDTYSGKSQLVIDDLKEIFEFKYGYIFYKDSDDSLCRVRIDGANREILSEDVGEIITIKNNFIYYSILESESKKNSQKNTSVLKNILSAVDNKNTEQVKASNNKLFANEEKEENPFSFFTAKTIRSLYRMNADGNAKQKLSFDIINAKEHSENMIDFIVKSNNHKFDQQLMRLNTETLETNLITYLGVEKELSKSKAVAALLGFIFGQFGLHNFYLKYYLRGSIQLVVTLLGYLFATPLLPILSAISAIIEVFMIFNGTPSTSKDNIIIK
jgi:TM2 domain-containing membrane protein YozV